MAASTPPSPPGVGTTPATVLAGTTNSTTSGERWTPTALSSGRPTVGPGFAVRATAAMSARAVERFGRHAPDAGRWRLRDDPPGRPRGGSRASRTGAGSDPPHSVASRRSRSTTSSSPVISLRPSQVTSRSIIPACVPVSAISAYSSAMAFAAALNPVAG